MKKIKYILYNLLLFILLSSPIDAKASSLTLSAEALANIESAIDYLAYAGSLPFDYASFFAFSSDANKSYESIVENYLSKPNVYTINGTHILSRELTQSELELLQSEEFYDENGNLIDLSNLCYATVDNGYFTEHLYIKNDGSMAYLDANKDTPALDIKFGGSDFSYVDWENTFDGISNSLSNTEYNYSFDPNINLSNLDLTCYYMVGCKMSNRLEFNVIFVPNVYSGDCIMAGDPATFYFNNGHSPVIYAENGQVMANWWASPTYNGVRYDNAYNFGNYFRNGVRVTYQQFLNVSPGGTDYLIGYDGFTYDSSIASLFQNDDVSSYRQVKTIGDTIDLSKAYDMSTLEDIADSAGSVVGTPDRTYDDSQPISDVNYPIYYPIPISIPQSPVIPFPDDEDVTDDDVPIVEPLPDVIDPSLITNNIPIISGLENKFPFSIPWDIYKLVKGLSVTRETPAINETITIPIINYDWEIDLDLSMYDDSAELFRRLFLILFIIGLAVFSYQHFFGS